MTEEWRDIQGYGGHYQVSSLGNVRSIDRIVRYSDGRVVHYKGKKLRSHLNRGYCYIALSKLTSKKIHRLVAQAFIPNPQGLPQVNHIDENKQNNSVSNLEWCDGKYNTNFGTAIARAKANRPYCDAKYAARHLSKGVVQRDLGGNIVGTFASIRAAERETGIAREGISRCCAGRLKKSGGAIWSYA